MFDHQAWRGWLRFNGDLLVSGAETPAMGLERFVSDVGHLAALRIDSIQWTGAFPFLAPSLGLSHAPRHTVDVSAFPWEALATTTPWTGLPERETPLLLHAVSDPV